MTRNGSGKYLHPGHQGAPSRTSMASRRPSPRKLNAITVIMMARPGTVVRWGATKRKCLPSLIIAPQEGVGGATPRPRKLSPAPATIARAIPKVASTMTGEIAFGRMWTRRRRAGGVPTALADWTNSISRILRICPRMSRAYPTQPRADKAMRTLRSEGPRTEVIAMARRIPGKAKGMPASRMKGWSTFPAKTPAADPTRSPIARDRETVPSPTATETRAPWMRRLSRSRPSLSCPSQWDREGPDSPESSACAPGSNGASNGASTAASSSRTTTANPATAPRWRATRLAMVCLTVRSLIPDPRVDAGVQKIRQEVHGHRAESDEQDASLDQRVIPRVDRPEAEDPAGGRA